MTGRGTIPKPERAPDSSVPSMNYDEPGLVEHAIDDTEYRLDVGRQGTAMALSTRPVDTWDWTYLCEVKWDGRAITTRRLDHAILTELSRALASATQD